MMDDRNKKSRWKFEAELFIAIWFILFLIMQISSNDILFNAIVAAAVPMLSVLFYESIYYLIPPRNIIRFEFVENRHKKNSRFVDGKMAENDARLPERATEKSIGYDFFAPEDHIIYPGEDYFFWTDVKVRLRRDEVLEISPRSSVGMKKKLMLANTVGSIDPDYYGNEENDGNIGICLFTRGGESVQIKKGDRLVQGKIMKVAYDGIPDNSKKRTGGLGSTGK